MMFHYCAKKIECSKIAPQINLSRNSTKGNNPRTAQDGGSPTAHYILEGITKIFVTTFWKKSRDF